MKMVFVSQVITLHPFPETKSLITFTLDRIQLLYLKKRITYYDRE